MSKIKLARTSLFATFGWYVSNCEVYDIITQNVSHEKKVLQVF